MKTAKRTPWWVVFAVIALCGLSLAAAAVLIARAPRSQLVDAAESNAETQRVTLAIEGMHCDGCATGITAMLKRAPGIVSADVSYERKDAVIQYDPRRITRDEIAKAIANMGYKASIKK